MKRVNVFFVVALLIVFSSLLVSAQVNKSNFTEGFSDIKNKVVSEPVIFPSYLAVPFSIVFGINQGSPLNLVVIHFGVWFLVFIFVLNMASFVPYFKNFVVRFPVSLIITTLISISGGFSLIVDFLQSLNELILKITSIESYTIGFIIVFVSVVAILYLILHFSKKFFVEAQLDKVENEAASAGLRIGALQKMFKPKSDNNP